MGRDVTNMTLERAVRTARAFDVVAGTRQTFSPYVADMKAANPNLQLFVYLNGVYAQSSEGSRYPESWYAHDANGNRVRSRSFGNYMMDMSNPGWIADRGATCREYLAVSHYDHCYVDMLGTAPLAPNYNTALPIDPRTGKVWTRADLLAADLEVARTVRAASPSSIVASNGLVHGQRYFKPPGESPDVLLDEVDVCHAEIFLRDKYTPVDGFKDEAEWKQDVEMLVDVGKRGKIAVTTTKMWQTTATQGQIDRWHKYALASFLLGSNGKSYFNFSLTNTLSGVLINHPWDRVRVGTPLTPYAMSGGVYRRDFTNGISLVNPTKATVTVSLGDTYRDLTGVSRSSLTLAPNTGEVLTRT
jgi:hypothetical protein